MNRGRPKKEKCNHDCFNCCYPDCVDCGMDLTDFEKLCAMIANEPEKNLTTEHTIREYRFAESGRKISTDKDSWRF